MPDTQANRAEQVRHEWLCEFLEEVNSLFSDFEDVLGSEIEGLFLFATMLEANVFEGQPLPHFCFVHPDEQWRVSGEYVAVIPQFKIEQYRVDFAFILQSDFHGTHVVVVECDGHKFHEKTKEQARKDKFRERALVKMGAKVLRYSGSEIWADPRKCVREVFNFLERLRP